MRLRMKHFLEYLADPEHQQDDSPMYIFDGTFGDRCAAPQTAASQPCNSSAFFPCLCLSGLSAADLQGRQTWRHTEVWSRMHGASA